MMSGKEVEPGTPFKVVVTLFKSAKKSSDMDSHFYYSSATIHAKILRMGTVIAEEERAGQPGTTEIIAIKVNVVGFSCVMLKNFYVQISCHNQGTHMVFHLCESVDDSSNELTEKISYHTRSN